MADRDESKWLKLTGEWASAAFWTLLPILVGIIGTVWVLEEIRANQIDPEQVVSTLYSLAVIVLAGALASFFSETDEAPSRRWRWLDRWLEYIPAAAAIVLNASALTFITAPDLREFYTPIADLLRAISFLLPYQPTTSPGALSASLDAAVDNGFTGRAHEVLTFTAGALSVGATILVLTNLIAKRLANIQVVLGLTMRQITAAKRIRQPARGAIGQTLAQVYPKEVYIDRLSIRRQFPFVNGDGPKARIKLLLHQGVQQYGDEKFSFEWVRGLMQSAHIELEQSLFFIYWLDKKMKLEMVCYGTGPELKQLMEAKEETDGRVGDGIGTLFCEALNNDDKEEVKRIVNLARARFLKARPYADLLLSTVARRDGEELQDVMDAMGNNGLDRILLTSDKVPLERGIISTSDISKFLLNLKE